MFAGYTPLQSRVVDMSPLDLVGKSVTGIAGLHGKMGEMGGKINKIFQRPGVVSVDGTLEGTCSLPSYGSEAGQQPQESFQQITEWLGGKYYFRVIAHEAKNLAPVEGNSPHP